MTQPAPPRRAAPPTRTQRIVRVVVPLVVGVVLGAGVLAAATAADVIDLGDDADASSTDASSTDASTTPSTPPAGPDAPPARDDLAIAEAIGPVTVPSDCPLPLDDPDLLPNAPREYRNGVHEGIDFVCGELGRDAVASLDGTVLIANGEYEEPTPAERVAILEGAADLPSTPPYTLQLLFGRHVVIDHGVIEGAGHVVTIYAHLDEVDPIMRPGLRVDAGDVVGTIGRSGTQSAGTGADEPTAIQLHWEIHVDDRFLGDGLPEDEVRAIYQALFPDANLVGD